ncbi:MAG TPA: methyltransferase domain-containing protein [Acidimicrobiia bacterium]|nr:methyltransferase domain-containing protein [Acidimicrobiia bacterium]
MTAVDWLARWRGDEGRHWRSEATRYDEINRVFGEALIDAAHLLPGERVLDVGCGAGAIALEAARRVRPGGSVLAIDISPDQVAVARDRAARAGAEEVEVVEADAATYPYDGEAFDVLVSRNGLMFFDDPDAALANLARALRPGGRIAFTAPQALDRNPWIMVAGAAAAPHVGIPAGVAPGEPGPLGLADPSLIADLLERAGFTAVEIEELTGSMRIGTDVDDAVAFIRSIPMVRDLLSEAAPDKQAAAIEAVEQALADHAAPDGVLIHGNGAWLVTGRR